MDHRSIERRERHTIMSGKVVTFATHFDEKKGTFGPIHEALGPFEVSASRDAVIVHRAELRTAFDLENIHEALKQAQEVAFHLARSDMGNFGWSRPDSASEPHA